MHPERLYYQTPAVVITSARFEIPARMLAMAHVTSALVYRINAWPLGACFIAFGIFFGMFGVSQGSLGSGVCALFVVLLGVAIGVFGSWSFLLITASSGERLLLRDRNRALIDELANHVRQAVIDRG